MILVDVIFPELNRTIDFQLEENVRARDIVEEIAVMAARSCGREFDGKKTPVMLYSMSIRQSLDLECTLRENGVHSGDQLLFI